MRKNVNQTRHYMERLRKDLQIKPLREIFEYSSESTVRPAESNQEGDSNIQRLKERIRYENINFDELEKQYSDQSYNLFLEKSFSSPLVVVDYSDSSKNQNKLKEYWAEANMEKH